MNNLKLGDIVYHVAFPYTKATIAQEGESQYISLVFHDKVMFPERKDRGFVKNWDCHRDLLFKTPEEAVKNHKYNYNFFLSNEDRLELESLNIYTCVRLLLKDLYTDRVSETSLDLHKERIESEMDKFRDKKDFFDKVFSKINNKITIKNLSKSIF